MAIQRYLLLIGSMKSGTTTLFNYLVQHPGIAGARIKESGFFAFDTIFQQGRDWYEALFSFDPSTHRWAMDASTDYSKAPFCGDVRARMASFGDAEYRILYLMRHPLRRIESHARHTQLKRRELGRNDLPARDHSLDAGVSPVSLAASKYAMQLDAYRDLFDAGRVKLLTLEEMSDDPVRTANEIFAFLGLDAVETLERPENENRAEAKRRSAPIWNRLKAIPGLITVARLIAPRAVRHAVQDATKVKIKAEGRFKLTAPEEAELLVELRPDLIRLRDVYGVDIERYWKIDLGDAVAGKSPSGTAG